MDKFWRVGFGISGIFLKKLIAWCLMAERIGGNIETMVDGGIPTTYDTKVSGQFLERFYSVPLGSLVN